MILQAAAKPSRLWIGYGPLVEKLWRNRVWSETPARSPSFFSSLSQITRILPCRCLAMIVLCNAPRFFRTCGTWLSLTNLVESEAGKMRIIPTAFEQEPD
jgi:hypothetical protein